MVVQNIECQISTVLMKRFLDGENLPPELLAELEQHLRVCPECQSIVNGEGPSLEEVLDAPKGKPGRSGIFGKTQTPGGFTTASPSEALMQASVRTHSAPPGLAVFRNPRVLFLSGALAIVLIAMSTILRNPQNLLGPKAASLYSESGAGPISESEPEPSATIEEDSSVEPETPVEPADLHTQPTDPIAPESTPEVTSPTPTKTEPTQLVDDPRVPGKPTLDQSDLIVATSGGKEPAPQKPSSPPAKPQPKSASKPTNSGRKPAAKRPARQPSKKPAAKSSGGGGITVYGPDGKPIK